MPVLVNASGRENDDRRSCRPSRLGSRRRANIVVDPAESAVEHIQQKRLRDAGGSDGESMPNRRRARRRRGRRGGLTSVGRAWPVGDSGMTTAEYAVGIITAVAFAGLLLKVLTSDTARAALEAIVTKALSA